MTTKNVRLDIDGVSYMKASKSGKYCKCVGVGRENNKIIITNTTTKQGRVEFTPEEWNVFLHGVKNDQFDIANI